MIKHFTSFFLFLFFFFPSLFWAKEKDKVGAICMYVCMYWSKLDIAWLELSVFTGIFPLASIASVGDGEGRFSRRNGSRGRAGRGA